MSLLHCPSPGYRAGAVLPTARRHAGQELASQTAGRQRVSGAIHRCADGSGAGPSQPPTGVCCVTPGRSGLQRNCSSPNARLALNKRVSRKDNLFRAATHSHTSVPFFALRTVFGLRLTSSNACQPASAA